MTCKEYMDNLYNALMSNYSNCLNYYEGKEGALRLARDFGYGIPYSPKNEWDNVIKSSYTVLCVRFYRLKPPVNAKEWINEIWESINKREEKCF